MRAFFFFLLFKIWRFWQGTAQNFCTSTQNGSSLVWLFVWRGCVSGSALGRGAEGNREERAAVLMLRAVPTWKSVCRPRAPRSLGSGHPQHPASSFNYLKSQTARRRVCERPVSPRPPGAPTSCAASPVCPPASGWLPPRFLCFLESLWKRVWSGIGGSCQCCVPPLSLSFWTKLTTCLIFFLQV